MKNRTLKDSFINAFNGIFQAFKTEKNIKIHCILGLVAIIGAYFLKFQVYEWVIVIITITLVIVIEMLNTSIEYAINVVCKDKYNETAKYAKDIAAGATLLAAFGSIIIFLFIYVPKLLEFLQLSH